MNVHNTRDVASGRWGGDRLYYTIETYIESYYGVKSYMPMLHGFCDLISLVTTKRSSE